MPMVKVADVNEIPEGGSKCVKINGISVSIWNVGGKFYAIADTCPHAGAPLSEGFVDEEKIVTCPWHGWKFSVETGKSPVVPSMSIPVYSVKLQGNDVFIEV